MLHQPASCLTKRKRAGNQGNQYDKPHIHGLFRRYESFIMLFFSLAWQSDLVLTSIKGAVLPPGSSLRSTSAHQSLHYFVIYLVSYLLYNASIRVLRRIHRSDPVNPSFLSRLALRDSPCLHQRHEAVLSPHKAAPNNTRTK